jgi:formylglycine-generating enzyme required for sulfatase activity
MNLFLFAGTILLASTPKSQPGFHPAMNKLLSLLALLALVVTSPAAPPVVSNVTASQRSGTKLVDIYYDLADFDGDAQLVQMQVSGDGGLTYTIPSVTFLAGSAIGSGVTPGNGKHIIWNAGADWNGQFVPSTKVRVTANDGTTPPPPPGMVYVPSGLFQMGDNLGDGASDERPVRNVYVNGVFADRFEVSIEVWTSVKNWATNHGYSLGSPNADAPGHPVYFLSWYDAVKWCNARTEMAGLNPVYFTDDAHTIVYRTGSVNITHTNVNWAANGYRLPTEAEWEKAARGALMGKRYPWGDAINGSMANFEASGDPWDWDSTVDTSRVGYYNGNQVPAGVDMANGFGMYDVAGNISEWCWDWYGNTYYGASGADNDPRGPLTGSKRIKRGGGDNDVATGLRVARRQSDTPAPSSTAVGFRCFRNAQ